MRDLQKPLLPLVNGSIPECVAWAGIAEVMSEMGLRNEGKGQKKQTWGLSTNVSFVKYPRRDRSLALLVRHLARAQIPRNSWQR